METERPAEGCPGRGLRRARPPATEGEESHHVRAAPGKVLTVYPYEPGSTAKAIAAGDGTIFLTLRHPPLARQRKKGEQTPPVPL